MRSRRDALLVLGLLAPAILLRAAATLGFWPAYIANPDAYSYLDAAGGSLFMYPERPSGYPFFLRVADFALFGKLPLLVALQHLLGLVTGLLVYLAMRRFGAPRALALVPAAVVLFSGDHIYFEHAILSETLFGFLVSAAIYCAARTLDGMPIPWGSAAGALLAAATTVRTVALFMLPLLAIWLLVAGGPGLRRRLLPVAGAAIASSCVIAVYVLAQRDATGFTGISRTSGWSLYSRVAYFADCREFEPPAGTQGLCESSETVGHRAGASFYHHNSASPAWRVFGRPPNGDRELRGFAREVILHQPFDYARAVGKDIARYAFPGVGVERPFSGTPPNGLSFNDPRADYLKLSLDEIRQHWEPVSFRDRFGAELRAYHRIVRVHPFLVPLLLLIALAGFLPATRRGRLAIALMTVIPAVAVLVPSATLIYNWRYLVPLLPLLVGAATLSGHAIVASPRGSRRHRASA